MKKFIKLFVVSSSIKHLRNLYIYLPDMFLYPYKYSHRGPILAFLDLHRDGNWSNFLVHIIRINKLVILDELLVTSVPDRVVEW